MLVQTAKISPGSQLTAPLSGRNATHLSKLKSDMLKNAELGLTISLEQFPLLSACSKTSARPTRIALIARWLTANGLTTGLKVIIVTRVTATRSFATHLC